MKKGADYTGITISFFCHDGAGRFLMQFRSKNCRDEHERWDTGAGGLEFGDGVEETLRKEIREEYCAEVLDFSFMGFREFHRTHEGAPTHWIALDFKVRVDPAKVRNGEPHKFENIGWFTLDAIPSPVHSQFPAFLEKNASYLASDGTKRMDRIDLAELIGKTIHERLVGTGLLERDPEGVHEFSDENLRHSDVNFSKMGAYDILDMLKRSGYEIVRKK